MSETSTIPIDPTATPAAPTGLRAWIKLLRPHQWAKGAFIVIGPLYGHALDTASHIAGVAFAFAAFALASSACYIINDLKDREADRAHPRKRRRPLAAGTIAPSSAIGAAFALAIVALALPWIGHLAGARPLDERAGVLSAALVTGCLAVYVTNTMLYSIRVKHIVIADVMSLSLGFVLRVMAGCAAAMVEPSVWLLNTTLFLAMFLAFGKRLGERRVMGEHAVAAAREVQAKYTEDLLRMVVVVTGVACLVTYAAYVNNAPTRYTWGFNLLWLTMLPATYGLLRAIHLLEKGLYDDPTEVAMRDRPFQFAAVMFAVITVGLMSASRLGWLTTDTPPTSMPAVKSIQMPAQR